jgi:hypothetical protein
VTAEGAEHATIGRGFARGSLRQVSKNNSKNMNNTA